jgi:hypothetical protein
LRAGRACGVAAVAGRVRAAEVVHGRGEAVDGPESAGSVEVVHGRGEAVDGPESAGSVRDEGGVSLTFGGNDQDWDG